MPQTSNDQLGRRRFQLKKEQAIEEAIEKIRRAPFVDWPDFCGEECRELRRVLGELWIYVGKEKWEGYTFSTLTQNDLRRLLLLGERGEDHVWSHELIAEMDAILSHT